MQFEALLLEQCGLYAQAELCHRQSLVSMEPAAPIRVVIFLRLSVVALKAGNQALAMEAVREALQLEATNLSTRFILGVAKQTLGDSKGAKKEFTRAREGADIPQALWDAFPF